MPGIDDNARIHTGAECCLALTSIAAGDPSAAQQIMQGKPPTGLGLDLGLKRELVVAIIALAAGDGATAKAAAQSAADRAQATGYHVYGRAARRLLRAIDHPPAVAELPRLLYFAAPAAGSAG